ncbi:two-component system CheB/CheR fusion protein [Rhodopirellula rubra]|uniref:histidine kinase n=1 Tax=Aporhodopirellula rubra TaxID=980271 RepID=A0A7W5H896_9BACT|nr:CheR family methyltransferase [Aporhodopirellula rubra]MBB3209243.1 two-component system CheB/CheR fusion protein [Aporhodopirellula rubra]
MTEHSDSDPASNCPDDSATAGLADQPASPNNGCEFHVCTLGASAGGLEPLQVFFASVPNDLGVAYVVIQHLSPQHESRMPELLARVTDMPIAIVRESEDGVQVEADHVYLIPPGKEMVMQNRRLFLADRSDEDQLSLPIDHFLLSMAQDQGRFGIAMILSGTGGDGSAGIVDVHRTGGLVMAQDPRSCKFDSMPERAISTGLVDVVLPPADLADALVRYVRQSLSREQVEQLEMTGDGDPASHAILERLREHSKIDFSIYKPEQVLRRILRRQQLIGQDSLEAYADLIDADAQERDSLLADLLIGVTTFYRNREAFEILQHEALTKILAGKSDDAEVRIWVAGCATGEEAYTIAFMLDEAIERLEKKVRFKLFATDAHRAAIDKAAVGVFTKEAVQVLPQDKIDKYFIEHNETYQVVPRIRQRIVFVQHDLMKDAPFTRMDLVTCRNLLIYLQPPAQTKCLALFHFALATGGFLFLGSSETIGELEEEFDEVNARWRLFRKLKDVQLAANRAEAKRHALSIAGHPNRPADFAFGTGRGTSRTGSLRSPKLPETHLQKAYDAILESVLPAGFLIDGDGRLLHTFAGGGEFLQMQSGRHSDLLVDMIRPDLKPSLGAAIQHCQRDKDQVVYSGITMGSVALGNARVLDLTAKPVVKDDRGVSLMIVSFEAADSVTPGQSTTARVDVSQQTSDSLSVLQNELSFTRENLQATIEELESSNEELQATNEEMVSSNEELQSTNEELQSVNEELHTVNAEYHRKIAQLQDADDDMDNLLRASEVSVLFLDKDLCIRRFTPNLALQFGLRTVDMGRPITSFQTPFVPERLLDAFRGVLDERTSVDQELELPDGRVFSVHVTPFDSSTIADGVVVNYVDSTNIRQKEDAAKRWASIVESTADCIIAMDLACSITQWNPAATSLYGWSHEEAIGRNFYDLVVPREERGTMAMRIEQVRSDQVSTQLDSERVTRDGTRLDIMARLSPVFGSHGIVGISSIERDITSYRRQSRLRKFEEQVRANSFVDGKRREGWRELADVASETMKSRCLWIWRVDGLTGELNDEFSSFGDFEDQWLKDNRLDLPNLAARVRATGKQVQRAIQKAPPPAASQDSAGDNRRNHDPGRPWRLILKPLIHKENCVGVIGVLVAIPENEELDEVRSTLMAVAKSLAIQIYDDNRLEELIRISDIVENASDFIGTCDALGRMMSINRAGRLLTGMGLDEDLSGVTIGDLHSPESRDRVMTEGVPDATRTGHWNGETELVDRKGNRLPISELITSHRDEVGRVRYFSIMGHVISNEKGVQRRLEELIRETRQVSDMKTTFLANVSHDVRTPMTSVIGMAELLIEQKLTPEQEAMAVSIRDSGLFVTTLLNDLMDLSKVESGKLAINAVPTDLQSLLQEIERAFAPVAAGVGLRFVVELSELPSMLVSLDPTRVRQIIENLISNAIKFTDEGEVRLETTSENERLSIRVIDSGVGIENSMLSSVFDPYTQSSPTSTRRVRGAGLGLAISRRIAERMDGELLVESERGVGSRFTLRLPVNAAVASDADQSSSDFDYPAAEKPLAGKRVLLAEDTRGIQFLVEKILSREEVQVDVVDNGRLAVDRIQAQASIYDALILDMQMPVLDGYQAAREIRERGVKLPIIAMTASTMQEEQTASLDAGCDRFVPKPIDQAELLTVLWQLIRD